MTQIIWFIETGKDSHGAVYFSPVFVVYGMISKFDNFSSEQEADSYMKERLQDEEWMDDLIEMSYMMASTEEG